MKKASKGEKLCDALGDREMLWGKREKLLEEKSSIAPWVIEKCFEISKKNI